MDFANRPPSAAWESVPVPEFPPRVVWVWFKPASGPLDVMIQIPPETHAACGAALSMRRLMQLIGVRAETAASWTVRGATYLVQGGANPLLDQPLPPPGLSGEPDLSVRMLPVVHPSAAAPTAMPAASQPAPMPGDRSDEGVLNAFNSDWQALLQLETQLSAARKQLGAIQGQLQSLNRDLSPDERLVADNLDKKDWQDARRWLRDSLASVSRWIREHDIGLVSAAGNRNRFEKIYLQHVVPRQSFPGLAVAHQEFEQHRKTAQHLLIQMQGAYQKANSDGVARARQILVRIAAKVRKARENRGTRSKKKP